MHVIKIQNKIDNCLSLVAMREEDGVSTAISSTRLNQLSCRRATDSKEDLDKIINYRKRWVSKQATSCTSDQEEGGETTPPHYVIFCEEEVNQHKEKGNDNEVQLRGILIWYFGYSTWKGKVINMDYIMFDNEEVEKMLIFAIVQIARMFELGRIVYQVEGMESAISLAQKYNFVILDEWLTLQMTKNRIELFLDTINTWDSQLSFTTDKCNQNMKEEQILKSSSALNISDVHTCINETLAFMNPAINRRKTSTKGRFQLRLAGYDDAKSILNLVQGLAIYEKALDEVEVNESMYQVDGSGDNPSYQCILLEQHNHDGNHTKIEATTNYSSTEVVGMGFFYFGYKANLNSNSERFLFLEDLFIQKQYRGVGFGKAIMYTLAQISIKLYCTRFVWQALDWNEPALKFYNSIGAHVCQGLMTLRLDKKLIQDYYNINYYHNKK